MDDVETNNGGVEINSGWCGDRPTANCLIGKVDRTIGNIVSYSPVMLARSTLC